MVRDDRLSADQLAVLIQGKADINAGNMGPLSDWMSEPMWAKVKGLEAVEELKKLGDEMQQVGCSTCAVGFIRTGASV